MITVPSWAVSAFVAVFLAVVSIAWWGIKSAFGGIHTDIGEVKDQGKEIKHAVDKMDRRLVRVETILQVRPSAPRASDFESTDTLPPAA